MNAGHGPMRQGTAPIGMLEAFAFGAIHGPIFRSRATVRTPVNSSCAAKALLLKWPPCLGHKVMAYFWSAA
jgi:hypothetical protein